MKHEMFFQRHPVFTSAELAEHMSSLGDTGARTQEALLAYHQKTGHLRRIRRGMYAVIPVGSNPESYPVDPFLVASRVTSDSVLSHHTALEFHGRAYSTWSRIQYSATRPPESFNFQMHSFRGTAFPNALIRSGNEFAGVQTVERSGVSLRVTGLERTLVDVLDRPDLSGGWEEIWRSLESVEFFDLESVVSYALMLDNSTTAAKVGFFLEQHRESLMVDDMYLQRLRKVSPRQPHYLDRARRTSGRLVSSWNLVLPPELLERAWGEVL